MKNVILKVIAFTGLSALAVSCSSNDELLVESQPSAQSVVSKEALKTKTYKIRYGLLSKSGTKLLSGNYDVGSFIATDTTTGVAYDTYYSGGFQSLPQYYGGIPAGTYVFSAMQGQGGWIGYGSVSAVVSDAQVDADGYVTVYIPITWEE
ncbi:hypothetical protein IW15_20865 [Chryseobacterium soli]|uniref:Uncharacterized protein n=1 Tax=Chryseobacterium soli TaxID=445961 RepID=A0A086A0K9_9FLAO|nr:hypothetical protein [Chryseobacterium soli]KFF10223.1 hypothetical protein IW15_20865 [Chryseobacterium soli]